MNISQLTKDLDSLTLKLKRFSTGKELNILHDLITALHTVSAARSLKKTQTPLMIGLSIAFIGANTTESADGFVPPSLDLLIQKISAGLIDTMLPESNPGIKQFLPLLLKTALIGAITLTMLGMKDSEDLLLFDLRLHMAVSAGVLNQIYLAIVQACGGTKKTENIASDLLSLITVLLMIQVVAADNKKAVITIIEGFRTRLNKWLDVLNQFISEELAEKRLTNEELNTISSLIQEGKIAIENSNYEGFIQIIEDAQALLGTERSLGKECIESFTEFVDTFDRYIIKGENVSTEQNVGIVQA